MPPVRLVLPALCAVLLGWSATASAERPDPAPRGAQACRAGTLLQGRALPRALGDRGFRATLVLAAGQPPVETRFERSGRLRTTDGRQGEWELTDDEGLMTSGPGDAASYHEIRRHGGTLWACPPGGGTGRAISPG